MSTHVTKHPTITPAVAMTRLRAEDRGEDTSRFPPRVRRVKTAPPDAFKVSVKPEMSVLDAWLSRQPKKCRRLFGVCRI